MKINDAILGVLFILGAAAVLIHVQGFPKIPGQNVGPAIFPGLIATGIAICGVLLVVRGLRARVTHPTGADARWFAVPEWLRSPKRLAAFGVFVEVNVACVLIVEWLGFLITGFVYLLILMRVLEVRWRVAVPVAILTTLLSPYPFYKLLKVPLPWAVQTPIAW